MLRELLRDLARLVAGWWRIDQVRISPAEGHLLRLRPPCLIVVDGQPAEIVSRTVGQDAGGTFVAYECHGPRGMQRLRVNLVAGRASEGIVWTADGLDRELRSDEVATFSKPVR